MCDKCKIAKQNKVKMFEIVEHQNRLYEQARTEWKMARNLYAKVKSECTDKPKEWICDCDCINDISELKCSNCGSDRGHPDAD